MKQNEGGLDRFIRVAVGTLALATVPFTEGTVQYLGLLGLPILITGMVGYCGLYSVLGISTCKLESKGHH